MSRPDDAAAAGTVDEQGVLDVLARGELEVEGRLLDASNATLVAHSVLDGVALRCVYKPVAGERPLWDFPDGTLGHREVAAYLVSAATPWAVVPPTTWRADGPFGEGMCQLWVDTDAAGGTVTEGTDDLVDGRPAPALVDVVPRGRVPDGWRAVVQAQDDAGRPVVLVHADHAALQAMATLDAVINNADRKGGHVLTGTAGEVRGVDHGVCFNLDDKLRTVLWGWAGEPLPSALADDVTVLRSALDGSLGSRLSRHLSRGEVRTTAERLDALLADGFPLPSEGWPPIPWPAF